MNPCENNNFGYPNKNSFQHVRYIINQLVEINQHHIVKSIEAQNLEKYEESVEYITKINSHLEKICKNFFLLGNYIDQFPNTPHLIRENREILSQAHLEKFSQLSPIKLSNNIVFSLLRKDLEQIENTKCKKSKQTKVKWTAEEHRLFLEGISKFGPKKLKQVSELIRTRTVAQVRSHQQKYQIKLIKQSENQKFKKEVIDSKDLKKKKICLPKEKQDSQL